MPMINEAIYTLYEGVGSVEAIDTAMSGRQPSDGPAAARGFHRPRYLLSIMQVLHEGLADREVPALPAAGEIRRGRLARQKRGRGFYDYRGEKPVPTR